MPSPELPPDLLAVLAELRRPGEFQRLFDDLLTPAEVKSVGERWLVVKRLAAGQSQRRVRDVVGVSVSTVSRGSRQLKYGGGGFALAFDALDRLGLGDPRREGA